MVSGSVDELMRKLDEGLVPIIRAAPGYVAYYAIDSGDGVVSAVSVFEDEAAAVAANRLTERWIQDNLGSMVPGEPQVISGRVMAPS